jgi:hypothetical protein
MDFTSVRWFESATCDGVRFGIRRISLAGRLELAEAVRGLSKELEYLEAGDAFEDKVAAAIAQSKIQRVYVTWGLRAIEGLTIDGVDATTASLLENGPEELTGEIASRVRAECGLGEDERKN